MHHLNVYKKAILKAYTVISIGNNGNLFVHCQVEVSVSCA